MLDLAVDNTFGCGVVCLDRCWGLLVSHFFEDEMDVHTLFCDNVEVNSTSVAEVIIFFIAWAMFRIAPLFGG